MHAFPITLSKFPECFQATDRRPFGSALFWSGRQWASHILLQTFRESISQAVEGPPVDQPAQGDRFRPRPAVIKVLAKLSFSCHGSQVAICGCNNSQIHFARNRCTNSSNSVILQNPEQFRLSTRRKLTNLIQEDNPTVRALKQTSLVLVCPRESALHIPEEFTLHQTFD